MMHAQQCELSLKSFGGLILEIANVW